MAGKPASSRSYRTGGVGMGKGWGCRSQTKEERERVFWSRIEIHPSGCWLWTRYRNKQGYGYGFSLDGRQQLSHRVAWQFTFGSIPEGLDVLHRCDNPQCCNPAHLWLGTDKDNVHDSVRKGRFHNGGAKGERNGSAKLTAEAVTKIRRVYSKGRVTQRQLAALYGVDQTAISLIVRGVNWSWL